MERTTMLTQEEREAGTVRTLLEKQEERATEHFHSILAAVIVLGLLIIAGLVVGFVIVGLQGRHISDINDEVNDIWKEVEEIEDTVELILNCTQQLKNDFANITNITVAATLQALDDFFPTPLPLSRVLCDHEQTIPVPADDYVLISSNLTNTESFPFTSVLYNVNSGVIEIASPNLADDQSVIVQFEIRVFITEIEQDGIYSLVLSTSASNCDYDDCPNGFYSITQRYVDANPQWGVGNLWMVLQTNLPVQNGQRYFVFLGSKGGGGVVPGTPQEGVSTCAALYISLTAVTPAFLSP